MKEYLKVLEEHFKQNPPNHGDMESVLEVLYWYYAENNPIDNQEIRDSLAKLRSQFPNLSMQGFDPIFDTVSELCVEDQCLAFYEGLRLGVMLMIELRRSKVQGHRYKSDGPVFVKFTSVVLVKNLISVPMPACMPGRSSNQTGHSDRFYRNSFVDPSDKEFH